MTHVLAVVPSGGIAENPDRPGEASFAFMMRADVRPDYLERPYGFFMCEQHAGTTMWCASLGTHDRGEIFGLRTADEAELREELGNLPDCVLLVEPGLVDSLRQACKDAGHKLLVLDYDGSLPLA
jgi:hypothetical protein